MESLGDAPLAVFGEWRRAWSVLLNSIWTDDPFAFSAGGRAGAWNVLRFLRGIDHPVLVLGKRALAIHVSARQVRVRFRVRFPSLVWTSGSGSQLWSGVRVRGSVHAGPEFGLELIWVRVLVRRSGVRFTGAEFGLEF